MPRRSRRTSDAASRSDFVQWGALLAAQEAQGGGGIGRDEFLVVDPAEESLERLHLAVDAGRPQLCRPDEVVAVVGQIDCIDPAQGNSCAAAVLDPGPESTEIGGIAAPGRFGQVGRPEAARKIPQHAIPQDGWAALYYTHSQPPG